MSTTPTPSQHDTSGTMDGVPDPTEPAVHGTEMNTTVGGMDVAPTASEPVGAEMEIDSAPDAMNITSDVVEVSSSSKARMHQAYYESMSPSPERSDSPKHDISASGDPPAIIPSIEDQATTITSSVNPTLHPKKSLFPPQLRQEIEALKKQQVEAKINTQSARLTVPDPEEEDYGEDFSEDEVDHAALFADLKKDYERKKAKGKTDFADDVAFMKAEKAEKSRLKRLADARMREAAATAASMTRSNREDGDMMQDDEDSLFVTGGVARPLSTPHVVEEDMKIDEDFTMETQKSSAPRKAGRGKQRVRKADAEASMRARMEADLAKEEKKKKRATRRTSTTKRKSSKAKTTGKAVKDPKAKVTKASRGRPKGKASKNPSRTLNLSGLAGVGNSGYNMYEAANRNVGRAGVSDVNEKRKVDQLKALIASLPDDDRRSVKADQKLISEATKKLLKYNVRAAPEGKWIMRGMKVSLTNHQVLGAAWMKERETGAEPPYGGLLADEMGLGKTPQTIACMIANSPLPGDLCKTTLIVASPGIARQWIDEMEKFAEDNVRGILGKHLGGSRIGGPCALQIMQGMDVVVTTYYEVLKSYPAYDPPKDLVTPEAKQAWWCQYFEENKGVLHRMSFYRVILDEATVIKNHLSKTSVACRGLIAKHRWALTGTPIHNGIEEIFPYLKFLQVKHIGSFEVFKENFCGADNPSARNRLHSFLRLVMIRRTHEDELLNMPILQLPPIDQATIEIEFNEVERKLYEFVRLRFMQAINAYHKDGTIKKKTNNILTMLLRLRQLTAHPFLVQQTIEDNFELEDIDALWDTTRGEVDTDSHQRKLLNQMQKMILERKLKNRTGQDVAQPPITKEELEKRVAEDSEGCQMVFRFRKFLRGLREKSAWDDLTKRSWCHRCADRPDDPHVTTCMHVYCKECLLIWQSEANMLGQTSVPCSECSQSFSLAKALQSPCEGLRELGWDNVLSRSSEESQDSSQNGASEVGEKKTKKYPEKWIEYEGRVLRSSKTQALAGQVAEWLKENPKAKIIIFTQFQMMINVVARVCREDGWGYCEYHGKMSHDARSKAIQTFKDDEEKQILIASLKAGGIGLNLTMASRVVCVDLWWNSAVEQQAFCRVFRIGQTQETFITRFVIKNSIDDRLMKMQLNKAEVVSGAMGDHGNRPGRFTLREMLALFGPVGDDDDQKPFILVDDEDEYNNNGGPPPILPGEDESVGHPPRRWAWGR